MFKMNTYIVILFVLLLYLFGSAWSQQGRVIAKINPKTLKLTDVLEEGNGTFSVLDNNRIVLSLANGLHIIKNGAIEKNLDVPKVVATFDINKHGNGIIVCDTLVDPDGTDSKNYFDIFFYRVRNLDVNPKPIKVNLPGFGRVSMVNQIDMIGDSILRIIPNDPSEIILVNIDSLEDAKCKVLSDSLSHFIARSDFIGKYGDEYFFFQFGWKTGVLTDCIEIFRMINNKSTGERVVELGNLGHPISLSCPMRYDAESGLFYLMLVQEDQLVVREFRIKDFATKEK